MVRISIDMHARTAIPLMIDDFLSDESLMGQVVRNDSTALEMLYDRYAAAIMGVAYRVVYDRALAEEIVQETFWRIWQNRDTFEKQRGSFKSWLFGIARNMAIDVWRRHQVRPQAVQNARDEHQFEYSPDTDLPVTEMVERNLQSQKVRDAMAVLPPEQQEVIELAYFVGLTRQEIAQETGHPLGTVHTRARLALKKLYDLLSQQGVGEWA